MIQPAMVPEELARNRRLKDLAFFVYKIKRSSFMDSIVQQLPIGSNAAAVNGSSYTNPDNNNGHEIEKKCDTPLKEMDSDNKEQRGGMLSISPGFMISAQQKVKERERNIERFHSKMEDLKERISEDKEIRDKNGKKGRLEDFPFGDILIEKKEQVAGLLSIGPGVLVAARQKGKDRERNIDRDRSSKVRGERRPGSKLVETRTNSSGKGSSRRERRSAATAAIAASGDTGRTKGNVRNQTEMQRQDKVIAAQAEFPPLPGSREPLPQTAALNFASSALFSSTAPAMLDPFANDDSEESVDSSKSDNDSDDSRDEEDDDNNYNDDLDEEEDKDEAGLDDFSKPDLDGMVEGDPLPSFNGDNWNIATSISAPNPHITINPPAFGGLFSRPVNVSSTASLFSEYSAQMDLLPSMNGAHQGPYLDDKDEDDDFADDVVVFRPAFSRFNASPAPPTKQSVTSVNNMSSVPSLSSYPLNGSLGQSHDLKEMDVAGLNQNKSPHSMESIRNMFSDTYSANQIQPQLQLLPQSLRGVDHWHNNDIYDPSIESMKSYSCQPEASNDMFRNSGCPMEIPMGAAFGRPTGFEFSYKEQEMNFSSDVNTSDEWWKGTDNSMETQPCTAILSSPPPMEYVGMRSTRGPPALQHVPQGLGNTTNMQMSRNPIPLHPPGLVQPPPGFGSMADRKSGSENNLQSMQQMQQQQLQQQQQQQRQQLYRDSSNDLWTANPFYRSNG